MQYRVRAKAVSSEGSIPLRWWTNTPNFGDLLSPWLVSRMTGRPVVYAEPNQFHFLAIGSIAKRATSSSIVWGSGAFGNENRKQLTADARYKAVRGPLTRAKLGYSGASVPTAYGDPALLMPLYFFPKVTKSYDVGLVLRWSEDEWLQTEVGPRVKVIDLGREDVDQTLKDFLKCRKIVTSSLHGLIIADAYGIPSAWLQSESPAGGVFKYYDYFLSVGKVRHPQYLDFSQQPLTKELLKTKLQFDSRQINFNYRKLLDACPFLARQK